MMELEANSRCRQGRVGSNNGLFCEYYARERCRFKRAAGESRMSTCQPQHLQQSNLTALLLRALDQTAAGLTSMFSNA